MNPVIDRKYRREAVDLQPSGNVVVVETTSDNPFENDDDVDVYTQESGGMAGPDSRQRSRGLAAPKRTGARLMRQGQARVIRTRAPAAFAHAGFMPGMGDLGAMKRRAKVAAVAKARGMPSAYFMPGMGADPVAPAAAAAPGFWASLLPAATGLVSTAGGAYSSQQAARQADAQRAKAEAEARIEAERTKQSMMSRSYDAMAQHKGISLPLIGVAVAALAVAGFVWMGRRKAK